MLTKQNLFDQLLQIKDHQPVFAGDLIHKNAKNELIKLNWIMYYEDDDFQINGYAKGIGGYVLTELGKKILEENPNIDYSWKIV